jgi:hypothetical protein
LDSPLNERVAQLSDAGRAKLARELEHSVFTEGGAAEAALVEEVRHSLPR